MEEGIKYVNPFPFLCPVSEAGAGSAIYPAPEWEQESQD